MHLAAPLPLWLVVLAVLGVAGIAYFSYRRPLAPLSRPAQAGLAVLRALSLAALLIFLMRPTIMVPPEGPNDLVVPILIDSSRSMRVPDAEGERPRLEAAKALLVDRLVPALSRRFKPELFAFGETVDPVSIDAIGADARHSDLSGALASISERYRGRAIAGVVVLTDGAETSGREMPESGRATPIPVFPIGVGSASGPRDLEVTALSAGDPRLDAATVDLRVTVTSRGYNRRPFQLRILDNDRVVDTRRVTPPADGAPVDVEFTVLPDPVTATVYTADVVPEAGEPIVENNRRSVLVSPAGRKRRILSVQGSPGFDHSFIGRALAVDPGLEVDTLVRKGKNDAGQETFFVQAAGGRALTLATGFPSTRETLFAYDALIIANIESDFFTRGQLQLVADFVSERGGGLLVMGGKSFAQRGLIGTPVEEVLPVELGDRRGGLARASFDADRMPKRDGVALTADGLTHPIMRIGATPADSERLWEAMPPLAASAQLGGPRPGAQILAVTSTNGGAIVPLVAVQRYGRGRAMVFAGEASWRWKMLQDHTSRSHEFFWRQSARWLSGTAPDPVSPFLPDAAEPGDGVSVGADVYDQSFTPIPNAQVTATLTSPGGESEPLSLRREGDVGARFAATLHLERPGLYRMHVSARRESTDLGGSDRWFLVGGGDREFADPRLNEGVLRRIARGSGGRYATPDDATDLGTWLASAAPPLAEPVRRDLWHEPWAYAAVLLLLSIEWVLRRHWGLR